MNDTAQLPTYKELSEGMDAAMRAAMIASMSGEEADKQEAMDEMLAYSKKIQNGEYK